MDIQLKDKVFEPYIEKEKIAAALDELSEKIRSDYDGKKPLFLGVLNGCFMFASDLLKALDMDCEISFVKMASYEGTQSTGTVNEIIGVNENIEGRDIIILEDIVDTGNTLEKFRKQLNEKNPASVKIATLLFKPGVFDKDYTVDYIGIEIPDNFVVGYGLDYDGAGRNIDSVYVIKED